MRNTIILALLAIATLATGCKKEGKDDSEVTFVNRLSNDVTLDIYRSFNDYANNEEVFLRKVMAPNEVAYLPGNTFSQGATYYIDWYADDYYQTNWFNEKYESVKYNSFRPVVGDNTYYTDRSFVSGARRCFLKGNGTSTKWIAVDALQFSVSTGYISDWSKLTSNEKHREITINKSFIANYSYKNANGDLINVDLDFLVHPSSDPYIELKDANGVNIGNMTGGKLPSGTPPEYKSASQDTVLALFPGNDYLYMMVRQ